MIGWKRVDTGSAAAMKTRSAATCIFTNSMVFVSACVVLYCAALVSSQWCLSCALLWWAGAMLVLSEDGGWQELAAFIKRLAAVFYLLITRPFLAIGIHSIPLFALSQKHEGAPKSADHKHNSNPHSSLASRARPSAAASEPRTMMVPADGAAGSGAGGSTAIGGMASIAQTVEFDEVLDRNVVLDDKSLKLYFALCVTQVQMARKKKGPIVTFLLFVPTTAFDSWLFSTKCRSTVQTQRSLFCAVRQSHRRASAIP
jgi:hypothetical protein